MVIKNNQMIELLDFSMNNKVMKEKNINDIDNILISVGGGGLISGVGSFIKQIYPQCNIIGIEPDGAQGLSESLLNQKPINNVTTIPSSKVRHLF